MLFELRELENPPWTLVRRKKDPKTSLHVNSRDKDLTMSIVEPQTSINSGTWKRVDFIEDSGSAASCIPADMVNKSTMEPRLVGPTEHTSASNHQVRVWGNIRPWVQFQNGVCGRFELKVLEGFKKIIFSTSRMCKAGYEVHHTASHSWASHQGTGAKYRINERGGVPIIFNLNYGQTVTL